MGIGADKIDFNETGSMHMSNDYSNNERFIPIDNARKISDKHDLLVKNKVTNDIQLRT